MLEILLKIIRGLNEGDDIASIATKSKWDQGLACLTYCGVPDETGC